ncbi:MAG: YaiI/YqxD family protein [Planctomycetota bacterium]
MLDIYVDADACPVKDEVYRVALRYDLAVFVVANTVLSVPANSRIESVLVRESSDAADDWIAERVGQDDIVITSDVPLASRSLERGAAVIGPSGRPFTEDSIGAALASRELLSQLREIGEITGGPAPFDRRDRSQFLQTLDQVIQKLKRRRSK